MTYDDENKYEEKEEDNTINDSIELKPHLENTSENIDSNYDLNPYDSNYEDDPIEDEIDPSKELSAIFPDSTTYSWSFGKKFGTWISTLILLCIIAVLLYGFTDLGFYDTDDWLNLHLANYVSSAIPAKTLSALKFFVQHPNTIVLIFPTLSWMFDYSNFQMNAQGYYFTNILLHLFNCILIMLLAFKFTKSKKAVFGAGIIFGFIPLGLQAIYFLSARDELLCAFFMLLTIIFFITHIDKKCKINLWLSVITLIAALVSRQFAILLPFILLLTLIMKNRFKKYKSILPHILITVIYGGLFIFVRLLPQYSNAFITEKSELASLFTAFSDFDKILIAYKTFFISFSSFFNTPDNMINIALNNLWIVVFAFLLAGPLVGNGFKGFKWTLICIIWFAISLLPIIHLLQNPDKDISRLLYISTIPIALILGSGLGLFPFNKKLGTLVKLMLIAGFGFSIAVTTFEVRDNVLESKLKYSAFAALKSNKNTVLIITEDPKEYGEFKGAIISSLYDSQLKFQKTGAGLNPVKIEKAECSVEDEIDIFKWDENTINYIKADPDKFIIPDGTYYKDDAATKYFCVKNKRGNLVKIAVETEFFSGLNLPYDLERF